MYQFFRSRFYKFTSDPRFSEILTGSAWALAARVLSTGLALATTIIIARVYDAEVMGIVAVTNSFLALITVFAVLGTGTSILRMLPEHLIKHSHTSAFKVYCKTQYIVIAASLIAGTLTFFGADLIASKVFGKPHLSFYLSLAALFVVFKSLGSLNTQAVRGLKLIRAFACMQFMPQGLTLILLLLIGQVWPTMDAPVYALLGGMALTGIIGWAIMQNAFKKKMQPGDPVHHMPLRRILSISMPMLMTSAMFSVLEQTSVIILGIFRPEADVGYYSVAVKLATLTTFVLTAINSIAAPKFAELFHSGNMEELFYVAKKSTKLIFWTTTPVLILLIIFGKQIICLLFGLNFTVAYEPMVFLVIGQFVNSISGSTGYFMNMTGDQMVFQKVMLMAALLNLIANFLFVPLFGILGAALAGMSTLAFWNVYLVIFIKRKYGRTIGYIPLLKFPTQ